MGKDWFLRLREVGGRGGGGVSDCLAKVITLDGLWKILRGGVLVFGLFGEVYWTSTRGPVNSRWWKSSLLDPVMILGFPRPLVPKKIVKQTKKEARQ